MYEGIVWILFGGGFRDAVGVCCSYVCWGSLRVLVWVSLAKTPDTLGDDPSCFRCLRNAGWWLVVLSDYSIGS